MAPIKHNSAARNRDKTKKRKRPNEHASHLLYRCMGELCGEECEQELNPVGGQRRNDPKRPQPNQQQQQQQQDSQMDATASDADDADYVDGRERRRQPLTKAGRVAKLGAKKTASKQIKNMPTIIGLQKAERYLCNALDFGVQAGYLTPKDAKGRVLRVASGLLQTATVSSVKRINTDAMDARALERRGGPAVTQPRTQRGRPPAPGAMFDSLADPSSQEMRDDDAAAPNDAKRRSSSSKKRSRSKRQGGKKRSGRSRSRSRSNKRRHGRRRSMGRAIERIIEEQSIRSRSENPESGVNNNANNNRQTSGEGGTEEHDELGETSQETNGSSNSNAINRNDDDGKSVKSAKSTKSTPNNNDSQASNDDKNNNGNDNDGSNDDLSDDDDDDDQKK